MVEMLNYYEIKNIKLWLNAIMGRIATLNDLQNYIANNNIHNKYTLLDKLNEDFVKLPE